jgi:KDO2-lipid IV(A) lauroyltransferase
MDNFGRAMIEIFSGPEFAARAAAAEVEGEGLATLRAAHAAGRPVVLVTAHLGNYDAARAWLLAQGFKVGGFYRPLANPLFNPRYVAAISRIGTPLFPAGRDGMAGMVRFLRGGGMLGLVADHHIGTGLPIDFLGRPALTALSAAELALRYDAPLVPLYGIRQPDGLSFRIRIEAPVPHSDPRTMTAALNASAGAVIGAQMGQWFWLHRRWKGAPDGGAAG